LADVTHGRRRRWLLAAAGLAAAAVVVALALRGGPDVRDEGDGPAARPDATGGAGDPLLAGRGDAAAAVLSLDPPSAPGAPEAGAVTRIRGRVVGPEAFPAGSLVFVTSNERGGRFVARVAPDGEGRFDLTVPDPDREGPGWSVPVTAAIPGYAWAVSLVAPVRGGTVDVEIPLLTEPVFGARVVDRTRRPVAGLRVGLPSGGSYRAQRLPDPATDETPSSWRLLATAVTDADGAFEVRGLPEGTAFSPVAYDEAWWIGDGHVLVTHAGDVEFTARPAYRLRTEVRAADPADDPTRWSLSQHFRIVEPRPGDSSLQGVPPPRSRESPHTVLERGPVPDVGERGFMALVRVDTPDHVPEEARVEFGHGAWAQELHLALRRRPATDYGTLAIRSSLRTPDGKPVALTVTHYREVAPRNWSGNQLRPETRDDGALVVRLPAGPAKLQISAAIPFAGLLAPESSGDVVASSTTVEIEPGRETRLDVPAMPVGRMRVVAPAGAAQDDLTLVLSRSEPRANASHTWKPRGDPIVFPAIPEGTWKASWRVGTAWGGADVTIVASEETTLDLSR
jgi:hypothetical protein